MALLAAYVIVSQIVCLILGEREWLNKVYLQFVGYIVILFISEYLWSLRFVGKG
jgi:hypothetical protein